MFRDGDGFADLGVGVRPGVPGMGTASRLDFISSVTGAVLASIGGDADSNYGLSVVAAADLNEDGTAEILVGGSRAAVLGEVPGYVAVVSPVDAIPLILHGGELQLHNATGTHTTIGAFGSTTVTDNEVTLFGRNMAPASFGHFITSPTGGVSNVMAGETHYFQL